ncbi:MAG TPA: hypothetical protein DCY27_05750 [Desulfobacterales bacterium]|nr:hypothetical protein [Desulfobacterales bacterium]
MASRRREEEIRSQPCPDCYLCASPGDPLYFGLKDRLFGAPGVWNLKRCPNAACRLVWLDPMPREEEIGKAYKNYYTHQNNIAKKNRPFRQAYDYIKKGYLSWRFGYSTAQSTCQKLLGTLLFMHPYRRTTIDREMMFLKYRPGGVLLDVGCGSGEKMALFQSLGWQTAGIDLDELAIMQARKKGLEVRSGKL